MTDEALVAQACKAIDKMSEHDLWRVFEYLKQRCGPYWPPREEGSNEDRQRFFAPRER